MTINHSGRQGNFPGRVTRKLLLTISVRSQNRSPQFVLFGCELGLRLLMGCDWGLGWVYVGTSIP